MMPTETDLPTVAGRPTVDDQPFWDGLTEDKLCLPRCGSCDFVIWHPRHHCPQCGAGRDSIDWFEASGRGTVYSYTVVRRNRGAWGEVLPYVVAYVELDEGPRILTNIVTAEPDQVTIGMEVEAVFHQVPSPADPDPESSTPNAALVRFRPART